MCQVTKDLERQMKEQHEEEMLHELAIEQLEEIKRVGFVGDVTIKDVIDHAMSNEGGFMKSFMVGAWAGKGGAWKDLSSHIDDIAFGLLMQQIKGEVIG